MPIADCPWWCRPASARIGRKDSWKISRSFREASWKLRGSFDFGRFHDALLPESSADASISHARIFERRAHDTFACIGRRVYRDTTFGLISTLTGRVIFDALGSPSCSFPRSCICAGFRADEFGSLPSQPSTMERRRFFDRARCVSSSPSPGARAAAIVPRRVNLLLATFRDHGICPAWSSLARPIGPHTEIVHAFASCARTYQRALAQNRSESPTLPPRRSMSQ